MYSVGLEQNSPGRGLQSQQEWQQENHRLLHSALLLWEMPPGPAEESVNSRYRLCAVQPATEQQASNPEHACKVVTPASHRAPDVAYWQNLKREV